MRKGDIRQRGMIATLISLYNIRLLFSVDKEKAISGKVRCNLLRNFIISSSPREYEKSAPATLVGGHASGASMVIRHGERSP